MSTPRLRSMFPVSLYATPSSLHQEVFYTVPRAGHLLGGADHRIQRDHFPGHELIFCRGGRGYVRVAGRTHPVRGGDLVWINCHHPHEHGAIAIDPWEVYWIRAEGPRLAQVGELLSIREAPIISGIPTEAASTLYQRLFGFIASEAPEAPALIHAEVAQLIALAFAARQRTAGVAHPAVPPVLRPALEQMRLFYFQPHRVEALASACGLSPSHFARLFRTTFGTSPIDWLRRERISQAKRRLTETADPIKQIGEQVGYADRFYFSKDFRALTGLSPKQYREVERLRQSSE